jgi:integrase/recombinase XerD
LGELINLKWSDVDFQNRNIIVFGKLKTQTSIPIADKLQAELLEYFTFCKNEFEKIPIYVFVDRNAKPLTANAIKNIFKRLKEKMQFTNVRCCAYDFRHTFSHRFLTNGGDIFSLQKMLRHSDIAMSQRYLALWGTALHEQNNKFNPINRIDFYN